MKRLIVVVIALVGGVFAIGAIGDATQTRPDVRDKHLQTEVVIHIDSYRYRQGVESAAYALYGTCTATVEGTLVDPGVEALGDGDFRFAVTPSLGHHGRERLLGCLHDLTIDRVKSSVESIEDVPVSPGRSA